MQLTPRTEVRGVGWVEEAILQHIFNSVSKSRVLAMGSGEETDGNVLPWTDCLCPRDTHMGEPSPQCDDMQGRAFGSYPQPERETP